jgi:hypothetical protein
MEDIERIKDRLDNIASVGAIVNSLRVIAAGTGGPPWQFTERRRLSPTSPEVLAVGLPGCAGGQEATARRHGPSGAWQRSFRRDALAESRPHAGDRLGTRLAVPHDTVLNGAERLIAQQQLLPTRCWWLPWAIARRCT